MLRINGHRLHARTSRGRRDRRTGSDAELLLNFARRCSRVRISGANPSGHATTARSIWSRRRWCRSIAARWRCGGAARRERLRETIHRRDFSGAAHHRAKARCWAMPSLNTSKIRIGHRAPTPSMPFLASNAPARRYARRVQRAAVDHAAEFTRKPLPKTPRSPAPLADRQRSGAAARL